MAQKTEKLHLVMPNSNTANWGSELNNNMEKIDTAVTSLSSRIDEIKSDFGNMNYIYFLPDNDYILLNDNNDGYFTVGSIDKTNNFIPKTIYYKTAPVKGSLLPNSSYQNIPDFTGFYIYNNYTPIISIPTPNSPYDKSWDQSQILVKTSKIEGNTNKVPNFTAFPQALGGYYVPTDIKNNEIQFVKTTPLKAGNSYNIAIKPKALEAVYKEVSLNGRGVNPYVYTLIEFKNDKVFPQVQVEFFERETVLPSGYTMSLQKIEIDYKFVYRSANGCWSIEVYLDNTFVSSIAQYLMRIITFIPYTPVTTP